jgi:quinol monooxygenase YgiN
MQRVATKSLTIDLRGHTIKGETMYHIAVVWDIKPEHRDDFIAAALRDGPASAANEPGTRQFERTVDAANPNRFHLNEAYDDALAFDTHAKGGAWARFSP